jgi:hypothetical protein
MMMVFCLNSILDSFDKDDVSFSVAVLLGPQDPFDKKDVVCSEITCTTIIVRIIYFSHLQENLQ